ncbi:MAG: hypothetical protein U0T81_10585 [Saprospiraceae bacterium]
MNLVRRVVPGDSTEARIRLVLRSGNKTFEKYINYCEIIDSYNSFGAHRKGFDIDSREDSNNPDEASQSRIRLAMMKYLFLFWMVMKMITTLPWQKLWIWH